MTETGREIELKFLCAPEHLAAVLAAAPEGAEATRQLISVYFDTPDRALERAGVSLRVRESGDRRIQTLKRGKGFVREEYETPVLGFAPDAASQPLCEILTPEQAATLSPAFYVGVHRRERLVRVDDAEIEIAVDEGEVRAVQGVARISEVELELKSGAPSALFALAERLMAAAPLYLSFDSKASVGHALTAPKADALAPLAVRGLGPDATAAGAFQAIARAALAQIASQAQVLREAASSEAVHQLRVGVRRLRSALSIFAPLVKDADLEPLKAELRWLTQACDRARDLDVYAAGVRAARADLTPIPPGYEPLLARLDAACATAAQDVREAVSSERFRKLLLDVTAWVEAGPWTSDPQRGAARAAPARRLGAARLKRQRRRLKAAASGFAKADDPQRHRLRIQAKKLRYAAEAFAGVFPEAATERYVRRLRRLQDELGALNDAAVALPLVDTLGLDAEAAFAAGEIAGLSGAHRADHLAAAAKILRKLRADKPFWRER